jgi:hypothetical protein
MERKPTLPRRVVLDAYTTVLLSIVYVFEGHVQSIHHDFTDYMTSLLIVSSQLQPDNLRFRITPRKTFVTILVDCILKKYVDLHDSSSSQNIGPR